MTSLLTIAVFVGLGGFFVFFNMTVGGLMRSRVPVADKATSYECGEEPIGPSWVQFDLRFYIIALLFLVFDVEVALFYPWAAVYRELQLPALVDMLGFFAVLLVGFVYLWRFGYLEWVRSSVTTSMSLPRDAGVRPDSAALQHLARRDPEIREGA